jgi:hypothetical protein
VSRSASGHNSPLPGAERSAWHLPPDLFRASSVSIRRHVKLRAEAKELDPAYEEDFYQRWLAKRQGRLGLRARRNHSRHETRQSGQLNSRVEKSA